MQIHWTFEGCDEQDEVRIERCWEDRQLELEAKLASLQDEANELRIAVQLCSSIIKLLRTLCLTARIMRTGSWVMRLSAEPIILMIPLSRSLTPPT